jgi:hypothetical protein
MLAAGAAAYMYAEGDPNRNPNPNPNPNPKHNPKHNPNPNPNPNPTLTLTLSPSLTLTRYTDKDWRAGGQAYGWALAYLCVL